MIPDKVETSPPAKLNLFLELLGKRPDGYHDLETIMMAIDRRDRMQIRRVHQPGVRMVCHWNPAVKAALQRSNPAATTHFLAVPTDNRNLVVRACERFANHFNYAGGFEVELWKSIPAGAGMGGASSDAASALRAAAVLTGISPQHNDLWEIAAELGSDVPFFLGNNSPPSVSAGDTMWGHGCTAIARGRGDRLQFINHGGQYRWVVVYPPEGLSTAEVYRHCQVPDQPTSVSACLDMLRRGRMQRSEGALFNRLTAPARTLSSWIDRTLSAMHRAGLAQASMTGSGSACFAVARSAVEARRAVQRLASRGLGVCFIASPARLPASIRCLA